MSKRSFINQAHVEGYLYEHSLATKVTGENSKNPNTPYISGEVKIATDEKMLNIITIHYTYVTPLTATGKVNNTYHVLNNIVDGTFGSVMANGGDKATMLRADTAIALNEFYSTRNGAEELVSVKRYEGGFLHRADALNEDEKQRNTYRVDMVINNVVHVEANEERGLPEKAIVKGAIFDFRKNLLPVEFSAVNAGAISYFEGLGVSQREPVFTCLWGRQISETVVRQIRTASAFGEDEVREVRNNRKDFIITGAYPTPYDWDDESTITAAELNEAIQKRELDLAAMKARQEEYRKANTPAATTPTVGEFNF